MQDNNAHFITVPCGHVFGICFYDVLRRQFEYLLKITKVKNQSTMSLPAVEPAVAAARRRISSLNSHLCSSSSLSSTSSSSLSTRIFVSDEVQIALRNNIPVVALESTIISHGMSYPVNCKCAMEVEDIISSKGCVPATIAIIDGSVKVGLSRKEIDELGKEGARGGVQKVSKRDIAPILANASLPESSHGRLKLGATTVSATLLIADMMKIPVFVTGGIGGVHRDAETTFDISSDLTELSRAKNTVVVCAGVKSILDIGKTLEVLETLGVTTVGYKTTAFPAFFTRDSGFKPSTFVNSAEEAANLIDARNALRLNSGVLFAVPVPEQYEKATGAEIERCTTQAIREAERRRISGRDVTPFLLKRIVELSKGKSLSTNIALVKNNAEVGADIAIALKDMRRSAT